MTIMGATFFVNNIHFQGEIYVYLFLYLLICHYNICRIGTLLLQPSIVLNDFFLIYFAIPKHALLNERNCYIIIGIKPLL